MTFDSDTAKYFHYMIYRFSCYALEALSPEQKAPYTDKAKKGKMQSDKVKQTTIGESVSVIKAEKQREFDFMLNMEAHIRDTISTAKKYESKNFIHSSSLHNFPIFNPR